MSTKKAKPGVIKDTAKYLLSFDPGGSDATWAFSLSCLRELPCGPVFSVLEAGKVPVFLDLASPDFSRVEKFYTALASKWNFKKYGCSLVAERFVGRGITGKLSEYIPFSLGVWSAIWKQNDFGNIHMIMAAQWKRPVSKLNDLYTQDRSYFENWWEHYFHPYLPICEQDNKKFGVHIQDACAIGWWAWAIQRKIWGEDSHLSLPDLFPNK